jgi:hypothetical protein
MRRRELLIQEAPHLPQPRRMLELPQRVDLRSSPATFGCLRLASMRGKPCLLIEKRTHLSTARRVLQFPQGFSFNLPDALSRHRELLAHLFQRVIYVSTRDAIET